MRSLCNQTPMKPGGSLSTAHNSEPHKTPNTHLAAGEMPQVAPCARSTKEVDAVSTSRQPMGLSTMRRSVR